MVTDDEIAYPNITNAEGTHCVNVPPPRPFYANLKSDLKEIFFPDDPFRQFKDQSLGKKIVLGLQYLFPILEWLPRYSFSYFKSDIISGITIASLAIPQGISYAKLGNVPPILGLYSSFVPPLVYAVMGSSRDLAVGTVAVGSLLMASMLEKAVSAHDNPELYLRLAFTATFFAGLLQATLGFLRLGFIRDFLSFPTIEGFQAGAAIVICLQQLKGFLGLKHFTSETDIVSVLRAVFSQVHEWRWETVVLGCSFLTFLLSARYIGKKKRKLFWISAVAPLISVILGSVIVYFTHADEHGVQVVGHLEKGINPSSVNKFIFSSPHLITAVKTGAVLGIIALSEGIAVGSTFAALKNYHIDGNKEMLAFGMMNMAGSCTSCYLVAGPFSRSAVNVNAGCKTAVSNMVMAVAVLITLLFLTPLFYYTPLVVLSSIIVTAMLGLLKYETAIHLWKVDKVDFCIFIGAFLGVVFGSIEIGLSVAVAISVLRLLMFVARPRTSALGNIPNSTIYRSVEQYPAATSLPGILIIQIDGPLYFANSNYLRERISRWIDNEEDRLKRSMGSNLLYIILDMSAVGGIDTCGIEFLSEVKKTTNRRGLQLVLANPGGEVMEKLDRSKVIELIGEEWIFLTVNEAVGSCNYMLHTYKPGQGTSIAGEHENMV